MFYNDMKYLNGVGNYQGNTYGVPVRAETFYGPNYQMGLAGIFDKLKATVKKTTAQVKKAQAVVAKGKAFYKRVTNPDGSVTMIQVPAGTPGAVAAPTTPAWKKYLVPGLAVAGLGFFLLKRKKK